MGPPPPPAAGQMGVKKKGLFPQLIAHLLGWKKYCLGPRHATVDLANCPTKMARFGTKTGQESVFPELILEHLGKPKPNQVLQPIFQSILALHRTGGEPLKWAILGQQMGQRSVKERVSQKRCRTTSEAKATNHCCWPMFC